MVPWPVEPPIQTPCESGCEGEYTMSVCSLLVQARLQNYLSASTWNVFVKFSIDEFK